MSSPTNDLSRVPAEIWTRIFRHGYVPDAPGNVVCFMLVCKTWNTLAESVLYRTLHIDGTDALDSIHNVAAIRERAGRSIKHLVKHLCITLPPEDEEPLSEYVWNQIACMLYLAPQLESFQMTERWTLPTHTRTLVHVAAQTLRSLDIVVAVGYCTIFWCIGQLQALRRLKVVCENVNTWAALPEAPSIVLKELEECEWTWLGLEQEDDRGVASFLSRCTCATGGSWTLKIPNLSPTYAMTIAEWINAHSLRELAVDLSALCVLDVARSLCEIRTIRFINPPPTELFDDSQWPTSLHFVLENSRLPSIYTFLDTVLNRCSNPDTRAHITTNLRTVHLDTSCDLTFQWGRVTPTCDDEYGVLSGRMMYYAFELDKYGIQLLDNDGRGLKSYLSR